MQSLQVFFLNVYVLRIEIAKNRYANVESLNMHFGRKKNIVRKMQQTVKMLKRNIYV